MGVARASFEPAGDAVARSAPAADARPLEDNAMLKAAAKITRDLNVASPAIYWADLLASTVIAYATIAAAVLLYGTLLGWIAFVVAILATNRAGAFLHELTHIKKNAVPGFRFGWNVLVGIPLLLPSFLYEGVHNQHHAKRYYGTSVDPDYLPLALMRPWRIPAFLLMAALAPIGLILRFAVLSPLSIIFPRLRATLVTQYSALQINPNFRRVPPTGEVRRDWLVLEAASSVWAISLLALTATGVIPLHGLLVFLGSLPGRSSSIRFVRSLLTCGKVTAPR